MPVYSSQCKIDVELIFQIDKKIKLSACPKSKERKEIKNQDKSYE
jgi:hypothetical protein